MFFHHALRIRAGGQAEIVYLVTSSGTGSYTAPVGCSRVTVEAIGGGGNGRGSATAANRAGGGGGAYARTEAIPVVGGSSIVYYSVGAVASDSWARVGTNSAPSDTTDGCLGYRGTSSPSNGTAGVGGTTANSIGTAKYSGANGTTGASAAGGGAGGQNANASGTTGGGSGDMKGGDGGAYSTAGNPGVAPGGAGGGRNTTATIAGAVGRVRITFKLAIDYYWISYVPGASDFRSVAADTSGNVYTVSRFINTSDIYLAKYNSSGIIQWQRSLGGTGADSAYGVAVDSSGNVYIAGSTASEGAGGNDILIAKYNSSGTIQWQRSLGGTANDTAYGVAVDSSSNVYIAGSTASEGAGSDDILISKYNTSGTIQWQRSLGGTAGDTAYGVAIDSSGNVYIAGSTASEGAGSSDILIAKYNTSGTIQWQRSLGGTGSDRVYGVAVDSSGNVYIVGYANITDITIAKYNTSGTIQWQRKLVKTGWEAWAGGIAVDRDGSVYIAAYIADTLNGYIYQMLIAKWNTSGTIQYQRVLYKPLNSVHYENAWGIAVDGSGAMYVCGGGGNTAGEPDGGLLVKLPNDGSETGTYGGFVYEAASFTESASTLTDAARTLTDAARTLTDAARTLTDAAASLTSTLYEVY